jgi:uncharacterized membrane protein YgcG
MNRKGGLIMNRRRSGLLSAVLSLCLVCAQASAAPLIVDHDSTDITQIPQDAIDRAKSTLHIAYGHTSHGSQLITGMQGLIAFANSGGLGLALPSNIFTFNSGGSSGALDLRDQPFSGAQDLGNPDLTAWANATRTYLNANPIINVVMWAWCGQVSTATEADINTYLNLMSQLEEDYPGVTFVYMTGHLDGTGDTGNLYRRNQQIRDFCNSHDKVLFDFADIESFDPDGGTNYMALDANDNCDYDSDGNGSLDANWATRWQNSHTLGVDWYTCSTAHSQSLNGNLKAYAAWWLWAALAGWEPGADTDGDAGGGGGSSGGSGGSTGDSVTSGGSSGGGSGGGCFLNTVCSSRFRL